MALTLDGNKVAGVAMIGCFADKQTKILILVVLWIIYRTLGNPRNLSPNPDL